MSLFGEHHLLLDAAVLPRASGNVPQVQAAHSVRHATQATQAAAGGGGGGRLAGGGQSAADPVLDPQQGLRSSLQVAGGRGPGLARERAFELLSARLARLAGGGAMRAGDRSAAAKRPGRVGPPTCVPTVRHGRHGDPGPLPPSPLACRPALVHRKPPPARAPAQDSPSRRGARQQPKVGAGGPCYAWLTPRGRLMDALRRVTGKRSSSEGAQREVRPAAERPLSARPWRRVRDRGTSRRATRIGSTASGQAAARAPPPPAHPPAIHSVSHGVGTPARPQASTSRAAAEVQQQFKELTLSPAQREGKEPVFEGRVTGACRLDAAAPGQPILAAARCAAGLGWQAVAGACYRQLAMQHASGDC